MIIYPKNWKKIGQPIIIEEIENTIIQIVTELNCNYLSFSGGLDSSLMLHYMSLKYDKVYAYTMGGSDNHPDVVYAKRMVSYYDNVIHNIYIPTKADLSNDVSGSHDYVGDNAVRLFYKYVSTHTNKIIACDGIDEFMCGYYAHQKDPSEKTYYKYILELYTKHLMPLHNNSNDVRVYLPYLDNRLVLLFSLIPISEKVDHHSRKKLLIKLAEGKIPSDIINRRKYGFCDVLQIKK